MIRIDGSYGEGGGQILRTALSLSALLKKEVEIYNIRKKRKIPGLQPQHLTCVQACQEITQAFVEGAKLQSINLRFSPKTIIGGDFNFNVAKEKGSAGSVSLVLQSILFPLVFAERSSTVNVQGGTHVPWSPPFTYLKEVFFPTIRGIGCEVDGEIKRWGFYPKGGGEVCFSVVPAKRISPLNLIDKGELLSLSGISAVANLPLSIAERQKNQATSILKGFSPQIEIVEAPSVGKGTFFFLLAQFENSLAGFCSLGEIGKSAEKVAEEGCDQFLEFIKSKGVLEPHLADQLIPYLALADDKSTFTVSKISQHLLTNIWVVKQFLPIKIEVEGKEGEEGKISIDPTGVSNQTR
jgi:RNA 3'-phosphate cyclase